MLVRAQPNVYKRDMYGNFVMSQTSNVVQNSIDNSTIFVSYCILASTGTEFVIPNWLDSCLSLATTSVLASISQVLSRRKYVFFPLQTCVFSPKPSRFARVHLFSDTKVCFYEYINICILCTLNSCIVQLFVSTSQFD